MTNRKFPVSDDALFWVAMIFTMIAIVAGSFLLGMQAGRG